MSVDLGSAHGKIVLDSTGVKTGVDGANKSIDQLDSKSEAMSKKLMSVGNSISSVGKKLTTSITLPLVGVGAAAAKMAIDFDREMRNVSSISQYARDNFKDLKDEVLELSTRLPQSAETLARGLYDIVSSGFDGADAMKVLEASARAASAGLTTTQVAADAATTVLNAWGMEADDVTKVQDIMFQTVKVGKVTYEQLAGSLSRVASTAAAANVPFEQVGAAYMTMTKAGISAEETATALNQVLLSFIAPTKEAIEVADSLGIELSATALSTKGLGGVTQDLASKLQISSAEMDDLLKSGKSDAEIQQILAEKIGLTAEAFAALFPNVRALKGILSLTRDEGKVFSSDLEAAYNSTGAAADAYAEQSKATGQKIEIAMNKVKVAAIKLGDSMAPQIEKTASSLGKLADAWMKLDPQTQSTIITAAKVVAALGPIVWVISKIVWICGALGKAWVGLVVAWGWISGTAAPALAAAIGSISWPIIAIIAVIAALIAIGVLLYRNWDTVKAWLISAWAAIKATAIATWKAIADWFTSVGQSILAGWAAFKESLSAIWTAVVTAIMTAVNAIINFFTQTIPTAIGNILNWFAQLPGRIPYILADWLNAIVYAFGFILGYATRSALELVTGVISFWIQLPGRTAAILTTLYNGAVAAWNALKTAIVNLAIALVNGVVNFVVTLPGRIAAIWSAISAAASAAWAAIKATVVNFAIALVNGAIDFFASLPSRAAALFWSVYNTATSIWGSIKTAVVNLAKSAVESALDFFASLPSRILNYLSSLPGRLYSAASRIASSFWEGFKKGLGINSPSYVERAFMAMAEQSKASLGVLAKSTKGVISRTSSAMAAAGGGSLGLAAATSGPPIVVPAGLSGPSSVPSVVYGDTFTGDIIVPVPDGKRETFREQLRDARLQTKAGGGRRQNG
ncbi:MAG: phage tail tape measure protein [Candidatus Aquicultorales bacterium]